MIDVAQLVAADGEGAIRALAIGIVDAASMAQDGTPWERLADALDRLHGEGFTLHDVAKAVRADLAAEEYEG